MYIFTLVPLNVCGSQRTTYRSPFLTMWNQTQADPMFLKEAENTSKNLPFPAFLKVKDWAHDLGLPIRPTSPALNNGGISVPLCDVNCSYCACRGNGVFMKPSPPSDIFWIWFSYSSAALGANKCLSQTHFGLELPELVSVAYNQGSYKHRTKNARGKKPGRKTAGNLRLASSWRTVGLQQCVACLDETANLWSLRTKNWTNARLCRALWQVQSESISKWVGMVAQWYSACLSCVRTWVWSPVLKKKN